MSNTADSGEQVRELVRSLFKVEAIKFGSFKLRSGMISPIYIDLRVTVSYPRLLSLIGELMWKQLRTAIDTHKQNDFSVICGVPYTALPIATSISLAHDVPMVVRRKEAKSYGTGKIIEGNFKKGERCLVIEDLVTTGGSVLETVADLHKEGLIVEHVAVLLDREQGARADLQAKGFTLHSVLAISTLIQILKEENLIDDKMVEAVTTFIAENKIAPPAPQPVVVPSEKIEYTERAKNCTHPVAKQLFSVINDKKTNLCVAVDLSKKGEVLALADAIGPEVCMIKVHADIIEDFDVKFTQDLKDLAKKHNFLIFEDRKFVDIGNTVALQMTGGVHHIHDWADVITVHGVAGPGTLSALQSIQQQSKRVAVLLLAEMSSKGSLATGAYTQAVLEMGKQNTDTVIGFISGQKLQGVDPSFLFCTPGIQFGSTGDAHGQQFNTPESVIGAPKHSDVIIVGRGVHQATNPKEEAAKYRAAGWSAYQARIAK